MGLNLLKELSDTPLLDVISCSPRHGYPPIGDAPGMYVLSR